MGGRYAYTRTFLGHGNTEAKAAGDAYNGAICRKREDYVGASITNKRAMYNGTWWNVEVTFRCQADVLGAWF